MLRLSKPLAFAIASNGWSLALQLPQHMHAAYQRSSSSAGAALQPARAKPPCDSKRPACWPLQLPAPGSGCCWNGLVQHRELEAFEECAGKSFLKVRMMLSWVKSKDGRLSLRAPHDTVTSQPDARLPGQLVIHQHLQDSDSLALSPGK